MSIQTQVYYQPTIGIEGDFASTNPRSTVNVGAGGLVAGSSGVVVGRFAWLSSSALDANSAPEVVNNFGSGPVAGFVNREQQALITTYLADAGMTIPAGFPITMFKAGDFFARNSGASQALVGHKAYANYATGAITFAASGAPTTASGSTSSIAASTFSVTGSINNNTLTVTAVSSGTIYPGATISGTNIASGTKIVSQISGTAGGIGTYAVSIANQTVASTAVSGTYGTLTVGGTIAGTWVVGGLVTGTGISVPTTVTATITGAGGAGTYVVDVNTVVASTAITETVNVETKWTCMSPGLTGEIVKISSWANG